jgi:hypothetical protein
MARLSSIQGNVVLAGTYEQEEGKESEPRSKMWFSLYHRYLDFKTLSLASVTTIFNNL